MRYIIAILTLPVLCYCSGNVSENKTIESADSPVIVDNVVTIPGDTVIVPDSLATRPATVSNIAPLVSEEAFQSSEEAYDEGYYNGEQEGYSDAIHHLRYGYNYDDEPEYTGFRQYYAQGYEDGYIDGYNSGARWNAEND